MTLAVESARYALDGFYPLLVLRIDGRDAILGTDLKATLYEAGLVFLGGEWEDVVPPIDFAAQGVTPTRLRGFTRDPVILGLYRRFVEATAGGSFEPGPVPVPRGEEPDLMPGDDELLDAINDRFGPHPPAAGGPGRG